MISKEQRIKAIEKSIKHWEDDIVNPLKEGRNIIKRPLRLLCWEDTGKPVPLCTLHIDCNNCPLKSCDEESAWYEFVMKPNLETAQAMVYELKGTLIMEDMKDE